jgi:hypothetical protein
MPVASMFTASVPKIFKIRLTGAEILERATV